MLTIFYAGSSYNVLEEFTSANTNAIKSMLVNQIAAAGLEKAMLTGLDTGGCSVMTGKRNGVAIQLRRECSLHMPQISTCMW